MLAAPHTAMITPTSAPEPRRPQKAATATSSMPTLIIHTTLIASSQRIPASASAPAQWRRERVSRALRAREGGPAGEQQRPGQAEGRPGGRRDPRGRHADHAREQQRPGDVEELLAGGLQRIGGLAAFGLAHQRRPQRPHAGRQRRLERTGQGAAAEHHRHAVAGGDGDADPPGAGDDRARRQDGRLPAPVDQATERRAGQAGGDRVAGRGQPGGGIRAAQVVDGEDDGDRRHRAGQPSQQGRGHQPGDVRDGDQATEGTNIHS